MPPSADAAAALRGLVPLPELSPWGRRAVRRVMQGAAVVGLLLGLRTLVIHLALDPLVDVRLYYDAATRLNAGIPLYDAATVAVPGAFVGPPLLPLLFRPLALLPYPVVAALWGSAMLLAFVLLLRRILPGEAPFLALLILSSPILWTLSIGQAEMLAALLLAVPGPLTLALAAHLKVFPLLAASYWVVRREWRVLGRLALAVAALGLVQLALAPADTLEYLRLGWLGTGMSINSVSPWRLHPLAWAALAAVLVVLVVRTRGTVLAWPAAVALAVLANPRLLSYQLTSLLAAFAPPPRERG